jgi:hypothetical protein
MGVGYRCNANEVRIADLQKIALVATRRSVEYIFNDGRATVDTLLFLGYTLMVYLMHRLI